MPTPKDLKDANALANWIERHVPCYDPPRPIQWAIVSSVLKTLNGCGVSAIKIIDALEILEDRGIKFVKPPHHASPITDIHLNSKYNVQGHAVNQKQRFKNLGAYFEYRYQIAVVTGDTIEAATIIIAVLKMLWAWAEAHTGAVGNRLSAEMQEWEEFNRAVNEALSEANMLRGHLRRMTRAELKSLRSAPTPDGFTNAARRIGNRISGASLNRRRARRRSR